MSARHSYSPWRHGGWYVNDVRYPSGAVGCVSNNYPDRKWRIACDSRPFEEQPTFRNRDDAADAEKALAESAGETLRYAAECLTTAARALRDPGAYSLSAVALQMEQAIPQIRAAGVRSGGVS